MGFRGGTRRHAGWHAPGGGDALDGAYLARARHRAVRQSTGAVPATGSVTVTITWATPFPDAAYTLTLAVVEPTAGTTLRARVLSKTAAAITVRVTNDDLVARTGELHAVSVHDG